MAEKLSVLIADDHELIGDAVALALQVDEELDVHVTRSLPDTLSYLEENAPVDVVLLDLIMPGMNGLTSVETVVERNTGGSVVLFSGSASCQQLQQALDIGCRGIIPKTLPLKSLAHAIKLVAGGEVFVPFSYSNSSRQSAPDKRGVLTPRERNVIRYVSGGMTNKEIARKLGLSEVTIKANMRVICAKLGAKNRANAVTNAKNMSII